MGIRYRCMLLLALSLVVTATSARAQVDVSTSVFYGSPYMWRGQVLSRGFVFQPTIQASYDNLSLTFFGNLDPDFVDRVRFNEADLTAAYSGSSSMVSYAAGYTIYTFPTPEDGSLELSPTQEIFASIGLEDVPLAPSVMVVYDFDAIDGVYAQAGVTHELSAGGQAFSLGASLGLDSNYLFSDHTGFSHIAFTVGTGFSAGLFTVSPLIGLQVSLDEAYEQQAMGYNYGKTVFYGGIGIDF